MLSVVFVHNSQENADKYVHANDDEYNEEYAVSIVKIVGWNPVKYFFVINMDKAKRRKQYQI